MLTDDTSSAVTVYSPVSSAHLWLSLPFVTPLSHSRWSTIIVCILLFLSLDRMALMRMRSSLTIHRLPRVGEFDYQLQWKKKNKLTIQLSLYVCGHSCFLYHLSFIFLQVEKYQKKLDEVLLKSEDGIPTVPELYAVPKELVKAEIFS